MTTDDSRTTRSPNALLFPGRARYSPARGGDMLAEIVPPQVAADEAFGDPADAELFPEEAAVMARAVDKRRREFAAVRACARAGLARLGVGPVPILPGTRGAPQWPPGIVGSMTHCSGYRASAVARAEDMLALGLDAEPDQQLPAGVLDLVATVDERARLGALAAAAPAQAGTGCCSAPRSRSTRRGFR